MWLENEAEFSEPKCGIVSGHCEDQEAGEGEIPAHNGAHLKRGCWFLSLVFFFQHLMCESCDSLKMCVLLLILSISVFSLSGEESLPYASGSNEYIPRRTPSFLFQMFVFPHRPLPSLFSLLVSFSFFFFFALLLFLFYLCCTPSFQGVPWVSVIQDDVCRKGLGSAVSRPFGDSAGFRSRVSWRGVFGAGLSRKRIPRPFARCHSPAMPLFLR